MSRLQRFIHLFSLGTFLCLAGSIQTCLADVRLPHIFGTHMVLQRDKPVRFWGSADPDEKVKVSIGKASGETTADKQGKWSIELPAISAGSPIDVTIEGKNSVVLHDVLVGEVWLCSGQSNMQWPVSMVTHASKEIAEAKHPQIRLFT